MVERGDAATPTRKGITKTKSLSGFAIAQPWHSVGKFPNSSKLFRILFTKERDILQVLLTKVLAAVQRKIKPAHTIYFQISLNDAKASSPFKPHSRPRSCRFCKEKTCYPRPGSGPSVWRS